MKRVSSHSKESSLNKITQRPHPVIIRQPKVTQQHTISDKVIATTAKYGLSRKRNISGKGEKGHERFRKLIKAIYSAEMLNTGMTVAKGGYSR